MPVATNLPDKHVVLRFPPPSQGSSSSVADESYQLLELPAEIVKQVEAKVKEGTVFPLTIKGRPSDDAVLCTPTSTFLLRTVGISNSLLVCRPDPTTTASSSTLHLRDTCHQVLECVPVAANLERIRTTLRDSAWQGLGSSLSLGKRKRGDKGKGKAWTRDQLASVIQASDLELERGLRERNVVEVDGRMLWLPPRPLKELLTLVLSLLAVHHTSPGTPNVAPVTTILESLEDDHDVPSTLGRAVLELFGEVQQEDEQELWTADLPSLVRQVGNGLIIGVSSKREDQFLEEWKNEVGEMWADHVQLKLLEGEYLLDPPPPALTSFASPSPLVTHFPLSALPLVPATRFTDLFLTRPRWRPDDIIPFLKGLTRDGDVKERDKLVQKFVRVVKEKDGGVWWYPRRTG
ncbi:hypothetical protein IAU60_003552 [Kwoniella sp. DSM 27419]